jgi:hypothetical protein
MTLCFACAKIVVVRDFLHIFAQSINPIQTFFESLFRKHYLTKHPSKGSAQVLVIFAQRTGCKGDDCVSLVLLLMGALSNVGCQIGATIMVWGKQGRDCDGDLMSEYRILMIAVWSSYAFIFLKRCIVLWKIPELESGLLLFLGLGSAPSMEVLDLGGAATCKAAVGKKDITKHSK